VGTGCGWVATVPTQACIAVWFTKKRAFAMSVVLTGAGVGGFIAAPLLTRVIAAYEGNWRIGWYLLFGAGAVAALLSLLFVKDRPSECGQLPEGGTAEAAPRKEARDTVIARLPVHRTTHNWTVRQAVGVRAMWLIGLAAVGVIMPETAVLAHGVSHLRDLGHSPGEAAGAIGLVALGSIAGKLTGGFLCDRFEPRYVWCACNVVTGLGILVVTHASGVGAMYLFVLLMGIGGGASLSCWSPMVANYFGPAAVAPILGAQYPVNNVFAAAAPYLVGAVYDAQKSYTTAFYAVAVIAICSGLLLLAAAPPDSENLGITSPAA
jgi:sugar phosphate permease